MVATGPFGGGPADPRDAGLRSLVQFLKLDESQVEALLMMQSDNAQALGLLALSIGRKPAELQRGATGRFAGRSNGRTAASRGARHSAGDQFAAAESARSGPRCPKPFLRAARKLELLQVSLRVAGIAQLAARLNLVGGPALFAQGGALPPAPIPPVGAIPSRNRDGGETLKCEGSRRPSWK